jgi:vacuolar-type H+-ATPase subunit E/Vma4
MNPFFVIGGLLLLAFFATTGCEPKSCPTPQQPNVAQYVQQGLEAARVTNLDAINAVRAEAERLSAERERQFQEMIAAAKASNEAMLTSYWERAQEREVTHRQTQQETLAAMERTSRDTIQTLAGHLQVVEEQRRLEQAAGHDALLTTLLMQPLYIAGPLLVLGGGVLTYLAMLRRRDDRIVEQEIENRRLELLHSLLVELEPFGIPGRVVRSLPALQGPNSFGGEA